MRGMSEAQTWTWESRPWLFSATDDLGRLELEFVENLSQPAPSDILLGTQAGLDVYYAARDAARDELVERIRAICPKHPLCWRM